MNIEKIKKDIEYHIRCVPEMSQTTYNALKGALDIINAIEDIKAEIDTMADLSAKSNDKTLFGGLELALGIIEKHIGGKE